MQLICLKFLDNRDGISWLCLSVDKHFLRRHHRVAMNRHRIFHALGVAAGIGHYHGNAWRFRHAEDQFIAAL